MESETLIPEGTDGCEKKKKTTQERPYYDISQELTPNGFTIL